MADDNIQLPSLPSTGAVNTSDLMLVRQGSEDRKATIQILKNRILNGRDYTGTDLLELLAPVDGPGSGLNADLLDNQHGSFYQNASNLNTGTIPQARLNPSDLLSLLLTVDGPGSGLNADLLDNQHGSFYQNASNLNAGTIPSGRVGGEYPSTQVSASNLYTGVVPQARLSASSILNLLLAVDGPGSGLNADLLDNQHGSFYRNAINLNTGTVSNDRLNNATTSGRGIIELATQGEVNAGSDNVRAVTPNTLAGALTTLSGITSNGGNTGSLIIPYSSSNAIVINWGSVFAANDTTVTATYDQSLSSVYQGVVTNRTTGSNNDATTCVPGTSSIQIRNNAANATAMYIVIGRLSI